MLDNLCHYLLVTQLSQYNCHVAVLQLSQLKACLPHLKSIVASITALGRAWAKAAQSPGGVSPFAWNHAPAQDASSQEHKCTPPLQADTMTGAKHEYDGLFTSMCSEYHCGMSLHVVVHNLQVWNLAQRGTALKHAFAAFSLQPWTTSCCS
jgi:hypothetical protein